MVWEDGTVDTVPPSLTSLAVLADPSDLNRIGVLQVGLHELVAAGCYELRIEAGEKQSLWHRAKRRRPPSTIWVRRGQAPAPEDAALRRLDRVLQRAGVPQDDRSAGITVTQLGRAFFGDKHPETVDLVPHLTADLVRDGLLEEIQRPRRRGGEITRELRPTDAGEAALRAAGLGSGRARVVKAVLRGTVTGRTAAFDGAAADDAVRRRVDADARWVTGLNFRLALGDSIGVGALGAVSDMGQSFDRAVGDGFSSAWEALGSPLDGGGGFDGGGGSDGGGGGGGG